MSEEKKAYEADTGEYELDFDAEPTEVEIADDESPSSKTRSVSDSDDDSGSDHEEYASSVQKRIDKLTKKMREAERREQAALEYAQNVQSEVHQLKGRVKSLDEGYLSEYGTRLTQEQHSAENELRRAVDMGDSEAVVNAQRKLTQLAMAGEKYRSAMLQRQAQMQQEQMYTQQAQMRPQQAPQQQRRPDPKAEDWAENNDWFGKDEAMTFAAFGIHKRLVEEEGFDPQTDDYYNELDKRIHVAFPHKFNGTGRRPAQAVAGVSRGSNAGRGRKVRLSRSQVAIAKKLGVPLEEYAKYVKE